MEDHAPLIERAFSFTPSEQSYTVEHIEGDLPDFIGGTYYMNGPARFSRGNLRYNHWLDGDGRTAGSDWHIFKSPRTISGRLCIVLPDPEFSRAATAAASGFEAKFRK